jgi:bacillithiol biosynthesis deacetylase BshB1
MGESGAIIEIYEIYLIATEGAIRYIDRNMKLDVLAIGAHPDDIDLSCGGTIIKLAAQGYKVGMLDLTEGELGTRGSREIRLKEAENARVILGALVRENVRIPDGNIENTLENRSRVIRMIRRYRPDVLLIPHRTDRHPDHEHAHVLSREAWFYSGLEKIVTEDGGVSLEPWRPRAYYHFMQWFEFVPSFIVDITAEYDRRMEAVRAFRSQFFDPESNERSTILSTPDFMEMLRTRMENYGDRIGKRYGEPFFSPAPLQVHDIVTLND